MRGRQLRQNLRIFQDQIMTLPFNQLFEKLVINYYNYGLYNPPNYKEKDYLADQKKLSRF